MSGKRGREPKASPPPDEPTDTAEPSGLQVLPDASAGAGETRREVVTERDPSSGRVVETVEAEDLEAASHWDEDLWKRLR